MDIWIPTLGRLSQDTFMSLPPQIKDEVTFVTSSHDSLHISGENVMRTPPEVVGIAQTRQWIIEQSIKNGSKKCLMLDDDLVFAERRKDDPTRFMPTSADVITNMVTSISQLLDLYAHVGVATREGGNRSVANYEWNTRLLRILAYRTDVLRERNIRFDRLELMEDFDVTLQLLEEGYENIKINWVVHNQRSSNAPGGCSTYRTLERQAEAAYKLQSLHPRFVKTVEKTTKGAWNGNTRTDVNIQWKQAIKSARSLVILDRGEKSNTTAKGAGPQKTLE